MTLSKRLTFFFVLYALALFAACIALTVISLYAIEDGFFDRKLHAIAQQLQSQPNPAANNIDILPNIRFYAGQATSPFSQVRLEPGQVTEISQEKQYYHLLSFDLPDHTKGLLAYNVSQELVVTDSLDDLSSLFLPLLLLILLLTVFSASFFSKLILSPLQKLVNAVSKKEVHSELQRLREEIKEQDIKQLVLSFASTWQQREQLLNDQITFNKGISHELGTPLQIAKHASELIQTHDPVSQRALTRLCLSLQKMEKTSAAFLWLSTNNAWTTPVGTGDILDSIINNVRPQLHKRRIQITPRLEGECQFMAPSEVISVVLESLLQNALNHCEGDLITITSTAGAISISNRYDPEAKTEGFGIGMLLVKQLTKRFDIQLKVNKTDNEFEVSLHSNL